MLVRNIKGVLAILGSLIFVSSTLLFLRFHDDSKRASPYFAGRKKAASSQTSAQDLLLGESERHIDKYDKNMFGKPVHQVFSATTKKGKYFDIVFGEYEAYNPSIIPHPEKDDVWIIIAQQQRTDVWNTVWFAELVCNAKFVMGVLTCIKSPLILPISATTGNPDKCTGNLSFLRFNVGPHDARVFYGPNNPYIIYGSQSSYNCFGQWIQDLRLLTDWGIVTTSNTDAQNPFRASTEMQRPGVYGVMEKNWFLFWDNNGQRYAHYDMKPGRSFAAIAADGSAGPDLAPLTAANDEKCMARFMPQLAPSLESIHQATNSLSVTLCKRSDPTCKPTAANTFIMTIFQHKTYYNYHSVYEPYIMLFQQNAPFAVHGISQKPIWIHGREVAPKPAELGPDHPWLETEMFYITSMAWKSHNQKYHGYLDDTLFLAFGIEDKRAAGIDVVAEDILDHMGLCAEVLAEPAPVPAPVPAPAPVPMPVPEMPASNPLEVFVDTPVAPAPVPVAAPEVVDPGTASGFGAESLDAMVDSSLVIPADGGLMGR